LIIYSETILINKRRAIEERKKVGRKREKRTNENLLRYFIACFKLYLFFLLLSEQSFSVIVLCIFCFI